MWPLPRITYQSFSIGCERRADLIEALYADTDPDIVKVRPKAAIA
jgi:hypothetical protein